MDTLWDTMLCVFFFFDHTVKQVCNIFLVKGVVWSFYYFGSLVNVRWRVGGDKQIALWS